jgi:Cof subfamily protein (haloacid dehalogenase superfamily)
MIAGMAGRRLLYRLVVADVDGTLVERGGDVPPEAREAIRRFREAGGTFVLATGRPLPGVLHYLEELGIEEPAIILNGAQVYDRKRGQVVYHRSLSREVTVRAVELSGRFDLEPFLYYDGQVYVRGPGPRVSHYEKKDRLVCRPVGDLRALALEREEGAAKMLFIGPVKEGFALGEALREEGFALHVVQSDADFVEILAPGTSKGAALRWLMGRLGIPREEVMAIGDQQNDRELLEEAGCGVAVANAVEELKGVASLVTRAPLGWGVAEALARVYG